MRKIALILTILFFTSCGIKLGRNDRIKRELPSAAMQDFIYTYTAEQSGFREWEIKANQAHTYDNSDIVYLYNLTMTLFSESNQIKTVLVANKGSVQQSIGNLIAEGEVRIFSSNQSELQTEKIFWDQQRELFYSETNKLVTYIRERHKITGYDMVADSLLENIELDNSVGQINTDDDSGNTTTTSATTDTTAPTTTNTQNIDDTSDTNTNNTEVDSTSPNNNTLNLEDEFRITEEELNQG